MDDQLTHGLQIQEHYGLTYLIVSLLFLSPFVGYTLSALLNDLLHRKIGQRGVGSLCACCHLTAYVIIACHPPYPHHLSLAAAAAEAGAGCCSYACAREV